MNQVVIYIVIGAIGVWLGRFLGEKRKGVWAKPADREEMVKMQTQAKAAISKKVQTKKDKIFQAAKQKGKITNNDVERMFCGMSDSTAGRYLNELEKDGKLKQVGVHGRGVYYVPSKV